MNKFFNRPKLAARVQALEDTSELTRLRQQCQEDAKLIQAQGERIEELLEKNSMYASVSEVQGQRIQKLNEENRAMRDHIRELEKERALGVARIAAAQQVLSGSLAR